MKTYFSDIIPKIKRFSKDLDNLTLLMDQHWVLIDEINTAKNKYIFRSNNELLISQNGIVERATWQYLGQNSLVIDKNEGCYLFKHGFFDENILALKIDSREEYAFLINESKCDNELNSLDAVANFLQKKYLGYNPTYKPIGPVNAYTIPNYRIVKKIKVRSPFSTSRTEENCIEWDDGLKIRVFVNLSTKDTFFWAQVGKWGPQKCIYYDFESCVNSSYHYLKTGKILNKGLKEF